MNKIKRGSIKLISLASTLLFPLLMGDNKNIINVKASQMTSFFHTKNKHLLF